MIEKHSTILGVRISIVDLNDALEKIAGLLRKNTDTLQMINYANVHAINIAHHDSTFREIINNSYMVFCDGFGVKLAAKILNREIGQRMTPPDWIDDLFGICVKEKKNVFILGDEGKVIELFVRKVKENHPGLIIGGYNNGYFNKHNSENDSVIKNINSSKCDILIVGMGMPLQEKWIYENRQKLKVKISLTVGALFRWYCNYEKRAPRWMTDRGLEWLARLMLNPKKLFRRYVIGNPVFLYRVLKERIGINIRP
jgi:N-acetylglucosaminyldiphosphoundecaprenol N-acetyl-beta-D-mannosaminyltransferase